MVGLLFVEGLEGPRCSGRPRRCNHATIRATRDHLRTGAARQRVLSARPRDARAISASPPTAARMLLHWLVPGHVLGMAALLHGTLHLSCQCRDRPGEFVADLGSPTILSLSTDIRASGATRCRWAPGYLDWYIAAHAALISDTAPAASGLGARAPDGRDWA